MKKSLMLLFALALFAPSVSHAFPGMDVDVSVGYEMPKPTGTISLGGTSFDVANDLNLGSGSDIIGRLDINHSVPVLPNIYIHYLPVEVKGEKGGKSAEIKIKQTDIGFYYNLPFLGLATADMLAVKLGLNARLMDFSASIDGVAPAAFNAPIPMLYLGADFKPIHLISVSAEVKALPVGSSSLMEYTGELRVHPLPLMYVGAGYSNYSITLDPSLASGVPKTNITFAGPYFVLGLEM